MPTRAEIASLLWGCLLLFIFVLLASAQPPQPKASGEEDVLPRVRQAMDRALAYLASRQKRTAENDGSWSSNQGVNALVMLAFLSRGHLPDRGLYGDSREQGKRSPGLLTRGKRYILSRAEANGSLSTTSMYEHGFATLALAELYGLEDDPDLDRKLRKAVDLIIRAQSPRGGWRYTAEPVDQDLSVTVVQVVALRAANNAEIPVPKRTFEKAIRYVRTCACPEGGYGYQEGSQNPPTTAAGVLCLQLLGEEKDPNIRRSLDLMARLPLSWKADEVGYFFYFHYYAMQAHYQAGGEAWKGWNPRVRELFLKQQTRDGSWNFPANSNEEGVVGEDPRLYSTAMATLILGIYLHHLPAFQR